jgi:two-component system chemotaxis response regulator CheV
VRDAVQLVLTDIEMPEMDGYMLAKRIKADARFRDVPVVMHSSLSGLSNRQRAQAVGIDEYVTKFEPSQLAEILTRRLA